MAMAFFSSYIRSNFLKFIIIPNLSRSSQLVLVPPNYNYNYNHPSLNHNNSPIPKLNLINSKVNAFSTTATTTTTTTTTRLLKHRPTKQPPLMNAIRLTIHELLSAPPPRPPWISLLAQKLAFKFRHWPYCAAFLVAMCFFRVERAPFSGRYHLVFGLPKSWQVQCEEDSCRRRDGVLEEFEGLILPPTHPKSVRAVSMFSNVAQAMHNVLGLEQDPTVSAYAPPLSHYRAQVHTHARAASKSTATTSVFNEYARDPNMRVVSVLRYMVHAMRNVLRLEEGFTTTTTTTTKSATSPFNEETTTDHQKIRIVSDRVVTNFGGGRFSTEHLEGRDWKVVVILHSNELLCGICSPVSTIVCSTEFLDSFSDAELAFLFGHELGHAIVQHHKSDLLWKLTARILLLGIALTFGDLLSPPCIPVLCDLFLNSLGRRDELEADHIGMMLMAASGYDPQIMPQLFRKQEAEYGRRFASSHPDFLERAMLLEKPKTMEPAMNLYKVAKAVNSNKNLV